jgi:hypothetical protein
MWYVNTAVLRRFLSTVTSPMAAALFVTSIAGSKTKILRKTGGQENRGRLAVFNGSKKHNQLNCISIENEIQKVSQKTPPLLI